MSRYFTHDETLKDGVDYPLKPLKTPLAPRTIQEIAELLLDTSTMPSHEFHKKHPDWEKALEAKRGELWRAMSTFARPQTGPYSEAVIELLKDAFARALA